MGAKQETTRRSVVHIWTWPDEIDAEGRSGRKIVVAASRRSAAIERHHKLNYLVCFLSDVFSAVIPGLNLSTGPILYARDGVLLLQVEHPKSSFYNKN